MSTQQIIFAGIYCAFGAGLIFLAVLVIRDSWHLRLNRVTAAMLFLAGLGPVFVALGSVISPYQENAPFRESFFYNLFYIWELFFPVLVYFSWTFPLDRIEAKPTRWRFLIFVPHVFHVLLVVVLADTDRILDFLTVDTTGGGIWNSIIESITSMLKWVMIPVGLLLSTHKSMFSLVNLVYVFIAVTYLYLGMRSVEDRQIKMQVRVIIFGLHIALGLYIFTAILPHLFALELSTMLTHLLMFLALVAGVGSIAYAIIRYQFLDIRLIVRQSLVYTASSALLVGLYLILLTQVSGLLESMLGQSVPVLNIIFIIVALILFQPINSRIDNLIKRMFIRDDSDYRTIINRLSARIINILDREQLFRLVEETLKNSMQVGGVGFSLYDDASQAYVYFAASGAPENRLADTDPMLGAIGQLTAPTFYDRIETWKRGSSLATMMQVRNVKVVVPLRDREHLLGFLALSEKTSGFGFSYEDMSLLSTFANQMVVALTNVRLYRESLIKQRLEEEMNLARTIQMTLLPEAPPHGPSFSITAHSKPSRTVGGDFYDFVPIDDNGGFAMVIADVSGKGMPAALLAAQIQAALRSEVGNRRNVSDTISNVNNIITGLSSSSGKYATLFYGVFTPENSEFEYANAGHNYPVLVRSDGACEFLDRGGVIVGAFSGCSYESCRLRLHPNDMIFFYTDGLSEAQNAIEEEYGEKRIIDYLQKNRHLDVELLKQSILREVETFTASKTQEDDTTLVILKINGQRV